MTFRLDNKTKNHHRYSFERMLEESVSFLALSEYDLRHKALGRNDSRRSMKMQKIAYWSGLRIKCSHDCMYVLMLFSLLLCQIQQVFSAEINTGIQATRSVASYTLPNLSLINHQGEYVALPTLLEGDGPVVLDFFFASCSTICPVLSASFVHLQQSWDEPQKLRLISIAIDPEHDTPEVLRDYRKRHKAGPDWILLTGKRADVEQVMKAFDAFVVNKMSHKPLTFIHAPGKQTWIRLEGTLSGSQLLDEVRASLKP